MTTTPEQRSQAHAKLFQTTIGQAVVFLNRDDNDDLVIIVQMWIARTDAQHVAQICCATDELTQNLFESFDIDAVEELIESTGLGSIDE